MKQTLDVESVTDELSPEQMDGWEAYDALCPIGPRRLYEVLADLGVALVAQKGVEVTRETFLPWLKELAREQSGDEQVAEMRRNLSTAYGV